MGKITSQRRIEKPKPKAAISGSTPSVIILDDDCFDLTTEELDRIERVFENIREFLDADD